MRGLYLGDLPKNESAKNDLFVNFGNLLYSIASPPMNMEAFKTSNVKRVMKPDQSLLELRNQPVSPKSAYKLATIMYNHALRYHTSDRLEWR
jgi:predicted nucleotidyltransferase